MRKHEIALRKELYGQDWKSKLEELGKTEAQILELRNAQKLLFAKRLKERMNKELEKQTPNIYEIIIEEKYEIIFERSKEDKYKVAKNAEKEIVQNLPEDPKMIIGALLNLTEVKLAKSLQRIDHIVRDLNSVHYQSEILPYYINIHIKFNEKSFEDYMMKSVENIDQIEMKSGSIEISEAAEVEQAIEFFKSNKSFSKILPILDLSKKVLL